MAAGQGFKTFVSGEVLTAGDTNGYLMQGVLVFADAAARTAAITAPQEGQTSYLKDTDVIQVYSGAAWVTKSGASPLTTKGDVYGYSTTDARIPVGTNDQVLTADSTAALGVKWATPVVGSMTQIATGTLSGSAVNLTSIAQTYKNLYLVLRNYRPSADDTLLLRFNNNSSTNYLFKVVSSTTTVAQSFASTGFDMTQATDGNALFTSLNTLTIYDYTNSSTWKYAIWAGVNNDESSPGSGSFQFAQGAVNVTSNVTQINFSNKLGNNFSGGTYILYGVN
jgi:hypothetical protein